MTDLHVEKTLPVLLSGSLLTVSQDSANPSAASLTLVSVSRFAGDLEPEGVGLGRQPTRMNVTPL